MPWVRISDDIDEHPKTANLSDSAFALFVASLAYCNRNLTDGFVPHAVGLGKLRYCEGNTVPVIHELENAGLWEVSPGGWKVHDYHDYQPSRATVLKKRENTRKRVARHRNASSNATGNGAVTAHPVPNPLLQDQELPPVGGEWLAIRGLSDLQNGLIAKLKDRNEAWKRVRPSYWVGLRREFTPQRFTEALQRLVESPPAEIEKPEGLARAVCLAVQEVSA